MIITVTRKEEVVGEAQGPAGATEEEEVVTCLVVGAVAVVVEVDTEVEEGEGVTRQAGATDNRRILNHGTIRDLPHNGATACQETQYLLSGT